jgi:integrase
VRLKDGFRNEPRRVAHRWYPKSSGNKTLWTPAARLGYHACRKEVVTGSSNGVLSEAIPRGEKMGVFKKGSNWWIDFYHQGKRVRRKVGPSKKVAEMALADIQVKQSKQEFLGVCEPKTRLFKDFAAEYLEYSRANKARSSYERDVTTIRKHLVPLWGDFQLSRITAKMIEDYKLTRIELVVASTVTRELFTVKNMFRKAVDWGYLLRNQAEQVKKLKSGTPQFRYLSREEMVRFLDACRNSPNRQLYVLVSAALNTGMRLGELTALQWQDVHFKQGFIRVENREDHHTKNYETRTIPMNAQLIEVLKKHPRRLDCPHVFHREDGAPFIKMRTSFENAVKRAGIGHLRFHDLRHTFASHLVMGGVDIRTVQELLGHKDIRMTMRYAHLAPDHMRNAVRVLDHGREDCDAVSEAYS